MKQGRLFNKTTLQTLGLMHLTVLGLSLAYPPVNASWLAWVAWTPWILACAPTLSRRRLTVLAYGAACVYWIISLHWISLVTPPGWIGMGLYMALLWPLSSLALQICRRQQWPLSWAAAVIITGAEAAQGFPLGGFFWRLLGHSQAAQLHVIQIADLVGAAGVSFIVALVNGTLAEIILGLQRRPLPYKRLASQGILTVLLLVACLAYGHWRLGQTAQVTTPGPRVGAIQSNIPQIVKEALVKSEDIVTEIMVDSRACQQAGADLIVWPETMVQAYLDEFLIKPETDKAIDTQLRQHARQGSYLMVGALGAQILAGQTYIGQSNSAFLYRPDGSLASERYDKMHLVLFGETLPFRDIKWLHNLMIQFTPYDYDYSLIAGTHPTLFSMSITDEQGVTQNYHFSVLICYEDIMGYLARSRILNDQGQKQIHWLVNSSNDGWFIRYHDEQKRGHATSELAQHLNTCVFRAVENRIPIIRSVNTGISALIDSTGRIHSESLASSEGWPRNPQDRTGLSGWFINKMPIDSRVSWFTRTGPWLERLCLVLWIILWLGHIYTGLREYRQQRRVKSVEQADGSIVSAKK